MASRIHFNSKGWVIVAAMVSIFHADLSAEEISAQAYYDRLAAQAREILETREHLLRRFRQDYPSATARTQPEETVFSFPARFLFPGKGVDFSIAGAGALGLVRDLTQTYRAMTLSVISRVDPGNGLSVQKRNERRAVAVGSYFFRHGGLPPQNLRIRSSGGDDPVIDIVLRTSPPSKPSANEKEIRGALVETATPVVDPEKGWPLLIDLSLLDPARIKAWSLKIIETERGSVVREFQGTSDVWVTLQWDGQNERGVPARFGEHQAFLSALTLNGERLEDSTSFVIRSPRPPPSVLPPAPRRSVSYTIESERAWAQVVRFRVNQGDLPGSGGVDLRQLVKNIRSFPEENVVIEGFADEMEEDAETLARRRAETVRSVLVNEQGVAPNRLTVRAKEPRRALEGENLQKAIVFFVPPIVHP